MERSHLRSDLLEIAKGLATSPGVYLMRSSGNDVLYVGKAKNLKNRVSSYFQPVVHEHPRIELLLQNVEKFEVILTESESEALILECTLIKRYKPKFNIRLKDDKNYPYIKIRTDQDFPKLEWTRTVHADGAKYFGPFPSAWSARQVLHLLNETYRLRDCTENTFAHRSRACLLHQLDRCSAPCVQKISKDDYHRDIEQAIRVLQGQGEKLTEELESEMKEAAKEERFEDAARLRDQIQSIRLITETQSVVEPGKNNDRDVFAIARGDNIAQGIVLQVRGGKLLSLKHYFLQNADSSMKDEEILDEFLAQHFILEESGTNGTRVLRAKEVLLKNAPPDAELIEKTFGLKVKTPKSDTEKQLIQVAETNAKHSLERNDARMAGHGYAALEEVQKKLNLEKLPRRMECFDISNTQGEDAVASRVVFIDGAPDKNLYRRYKIKTVIGANDFAMMHEVLERRLTRIDEDKPDLIIVDGGRGQLAKAEAVLNDLNIQGVAICGLAKARTESDFTSAKVESSLERVFLPNRVNPIPLYPNTRAYRILTHLRDEAHRFALNYHRKLRDR